MNLKNKKDIIKIIQEDKWMMDLLKAVKVLDLPDWWVCAGFVRSKIWDVIHDYPIRTPLSDIDVIYFDSEKVDKSQEKKSEAKLNRLVSGIPWSVKNQARMHVKSNMSPYMSSVDGIAKFPETVTALGVTLDDQENIELAAPWGIDDVINLEVRPTPYYNTEERFKIYEERVLSKYWHQTWPKVTIDGISFNNLSSN